MHAKKYQFTYNLKLHETSHDIPLSYDWIECIIYIYVTKTRNICTSIKTKWITMKKKNIQQVPKSSSEYKSEIFCNKLI